MEQCIELRMSAVNISYRKLVVRYERLELKQRSCRHQGVDAGHRTSQCSPCQRCAQYGTTQTVVAMWRCVQPEAQRAEPSEAANSATLATTCDAPRRSAAAMDPELRESKERFVSQLTGTTFSELTVVTFVVPVRSVHSTHTQRVSHAR